MKGLMVIFGLLCASGLACSKKSQNSAETPAPPAFVSETAATADGGVDLADINQALKKFHQEQGRMPANVGELATAGYLPRVPVPPAGRRFVMDPDTIEVRVEYRPGF
jgi:hypothetical protein